MPMIKYFQSFVLVNKVSKVNFLNVTDVIWLLAGEKPDENESFLAPAPI